MSYHTQFPTYRGNDEVQEQTTRKATITNADRALATLANKSASEADRLRAWLRVGLDLGAIALRDADRLHRHPTL